MDNITERDQSGPEGPQSGDLEEVQPQKLLERARARLGRLFSGKKPVAKLPPAVREHRVVELKALGGLTNTEIAREVGVARETVVKDLKKPHVQRSLKEYRDVVKTAILQHSAEDLIGPAFELARQSIAKQDAKSFDATMRGINALEKTTMSASGEAQKVEVDQRVVSINRTELYARIEGLLDETP